MDNSQNQEKTFFGFAASEWKLIALTGFGYFINLYTIRAAYIAYASVGKGSTTGIPTLAYGIGLLVGAFLWGSWADRKGRKKPFILSMVMHIIINILCFILIVWFKKYDNTFSIFKLIIGIALAGEVGLSTTIVLENFTEKLNRFKRVKAVMFMMTIGFLGPVFAVCIRNTMGDLWTFGIASFVSLVLLCFRWKTKKETELFSKFSGKEKTKRSLDTFRKSIAQKNTIIWLPFLLGGVGFGIQFFSALLTLKAEELYPMAREEWKWVYKWVFAWFYGGFFIGSIVISYLSRNKKKYAYFIRIFLVLQLFGLYIFLGKNDINSYCFLFSYTVLGFTCGYWTLLLLIAGENVGTDFRVTSISLVANLIRASVITSSFGIDTLIKFISKIGGDIDTLAKQINSNPEMTNAVLVFKQNIEIDKYFPTIGIAGGLLIILGLILSLFVKYKYDPDIDYTEFVEDVNDVIRERDNFEEVANARQEMQQKLFDGNKTTDEYLAELSKCLKKPMGLMFPDILHLMFYRADEDNHFKRGSNTQYFDYTPDVKQPEFSKKYYGQIRKAMDAGNLLSLTNALVKLVRTQGMLLYFDKSNDSPKLPKGFLPFNLANLELSVQGYQLGLNMIGEEGNITKENLEQLEKEATRKNGVTKLRKDLGLEEWQETELLKLLLLNHVYARAFGKHYHYFLMPNSSSLKHKLIFRFSLLSEAEPKLLHDVIHAISPTFTDLLALDIVKNAENVEWRNVHQVNSHALRPLFGSLKIYAENAATYIDWRDLDKAQAAITRVKVLTEHTTNVHTFFYILMKTQKIGNSEPHKSDLALLDLPEHRPRLLNLKDILSNVINVMTTSISLAGVSSLEHLEKLEQDTFKSSLRNQIEQIPKTIDFFAMEAPLKVLLLDLLKNAVCYTNKTNPKVTFDWQEFYDMDYSILSIKNNTYNERVHEYINNRATKDVGVAQKHKVGIQTVFQILNFEYFNQIRSEFDETALKPDIKVDPTSSKESGFTKINIFIPKRYIFKTM